MRDTAGEVRTNSWATYSSGPDYMHEQKQEDQLEPIYNIYVPIQKRWTIETDDERGSGRSVQAACHDDDGDDDWYKQTLVLNNLQGLVWFGFFV